jgi:hypothetical protein
MEITLVNRIRLRLHFQYARRPGFLTVFQLPLIAAQLYVRPDIQSMQLTGQLEKKGLEEDCSRSERRSRKLAPTLAAYFQVRFSLPVLQVVPRIWTEQIRPRSCYIRGTTSILECASASSYDSSDSDCDELER